jgi:hypothetical protein
VSPGAGGLSDLKEALAYQTSRVLVSALLVAAARSAMVL